MPCVACSIQFNEIKKKRSKEKFVFICYEMQKWTIVYILYAFIERNEKKLQIIRISHVENSFFQFFSI